MNRALKDAIKRYATGSPARNQSRAERRKRNRDRQFLRDACRRGLVNSVATGEWLLHHLDREHATETDGAGVVRIRSVGMPTMAFAKDRLLGYYDERPTVAKRASKNSC